MIQIFDMTNLITEFLSINNKYGTLKENIKNRTDYKKEFHNSYIIIDNLKQKINDRLNQILPTQTREKRALINALGSIIKTITGNLDQDDAERIDNNIDILKQNQNDLKISLNKQMTLLSKSIDNFQETIKNISHNQEILEYRVNQIIETINKVEIKETNLFEFFRIHMIFSQITTFYQNIYDILENIETAISFAKLNTFHNTIVNTNELLAELRLLTKKLTFEKLPFEPTSENILKLENTLEIRSFVKNKEIVFVIEIPLVEKLNYNLFQLFPLPTKHDKYFKIIVPNFEYLLINERNFGYSNQPCKRISLNEFLCNHIHSENFYKNIPCEVQLLRYEHNISNCNTLYIDIDNMQLQNIEENKWILVTNNDIIGIETCVNTQNNVLFNGTYLLELSFPCSLKLGDIVINTYKNVKHNFQNIPLPNIDNNLTHKVLYKQVKLLNLNNINFNKLNKLQEEITFQKSENSKLFNNRIYYNKTSIWTVLLYVILCIIISFLIWKYLWPIYLNFKRNENNQNDNIVI